MSSRIQGRSISKSIASPQFNITAFLDVTVNGVRVVVTLSGSAEPRAWYFMVSKVSGPALPGFSTELDYRMGESI
jgi:hypothetical protein